IVFTVDGRTIPTVSGSTEVKEMGNQLLEKSTVRNSPVRLSKEHKIDELSFSSFNKTMVRSPLGTLSGSQVYVYYDDSFIVREVALTYIRKPRKVSLILRVDSDLPENVHEMICDLAVE